MPIRPFAPLPDPAADRQRDHDRRHPERETLLLAAAGAVRGLSRGCLEVSKRQHAVKQPPNHLRKKTLPRVRGRVSSHRDARTMRGSNPNAQMLRFHNHNAHRVTKALAKASITMDKADLWHARLAVKTLRRDQRAAIAEVGE